MMPGCLTDPQRGLGLLQYRGMMKLGVEASVKLTGLSANTAIHFLLLFCCCCCFVFVTRTEILFCVLPVTH